MAEELKFRFATESDVPWLAKMNQELILDEGHRNKMTLPKLEQRMSDFLQNEYDAVKDSERTFWSVISLALSSGKLWDSRNIALPWKWKIDKKMV